jgi:hypothetical protein
LKKGQETGKKSSKGSLPTISGYNISERYWRPQNIEGGVVAHFSRNKMGYASKKGR